MKNSLISIIIPAYNSEDYIERSISSVINQTYNNLEIIVVNDGSSDSTCEIVKKFKQVKLLSKKNGGLCSARNYGVSNASGQYIALLDSDDFYEPDFILNLYNHVSGKPDQLVMCDFLKDGEKESKNCQYLVVNDKKSIFDLFLHGGIYNRTVNKLYPAKLIKGIPFPEGRDMLEDAYFTAHILEKCNQIVRIPYAGYNYIRHSGTYTRSKLTKKQLSSMYSNMLEKDMILSKHVSTCEYGFLSQKIMEHIKNSLYVLSDIKIYEIYDKIYYLVSFLHEECASNKSIKKFSNQLIKGNNPKKIKKCFCIYCVFFDSFKNKIIYLRYLFRKCIRKNK